MQVTALRALFLDKQSSYKAPLDKGDLITLQNRRLQDIAILMYKVKHKPSMSHENIRAISYALYTGRLQVESSRVRHPQI